MIYETLVGIGQGLWLLSIVAIFLWIDHVLTEGGW